MARKVTNLAFGIQSILKMPKIAAFPVLPGLPDATFNANRQGRVSVWTKPKEQLRTTLNPVLAQYGSSLWSKCEWVVESP